MTAPFFAAGGTLLPLVTFLNQKRLELWLLWISISKTLKGNPYGVYTGIAIHFWCLLKGLFWRDKKDELESQVIERFLHLYDKTDSATATTEEEQKGQAARKEHNQDRSVLITHSCRTIFYYIISTLIEEERAKIMASKNDKQDNQAPPFVTLRMAVASVHFGSFYRLLRSMEQSIPNCSIEFYEIDLNRSDWTLNQDSIDETKFQSVHVVICQHLFGIPFEQTKFFQLARKYNIPIVEDCVQSGSLFGRYKGSTSSDILLYSGGLDKTPSCFGAGFGYFRTSPSLHPHGARLYDKCLALHNASPVDTWKARLISCFNQMLHSMIAKNLCFINNILGLLAYLYLEEPPLTPQELKEQERNIVDKDSTLPEVNNVVPWYVASMVVRKSKSIAPFQHAQSGFLRRPSVYQLLSMLNGMSMRKESEYGSIANEEVRRRTILLDNIPSCFHSTLFPWMTQQALQTHVTNHGISEFSWVAAGIARLPQDPTKECTETYEHRRMRLCRYLNQNFVIALINTTWEYHEATTLPVGKEINETLVYLPNINLLHQEKSILHLATVLTNYCRHVLRIPEKDDILHTNCQTATDKKLN